MYDYHPKINPNIYLAIYSLAFFGFGLLVGILGPIIPYLVKARDKSQTQYSFMFMARSVGSILSFAICKYIEYRSIKYLEHKIVVTVSIVNCIFLFIFIEWESTFGQFLCSFIFGGAHYAVLTSVNTCLLEISQQRAGRWVPFSHALFGVGALLSPMILRFMEMKVIYVIAFIYIMFSWLCFVYPTPMEHPQTIMNDLKQEFSMKTTAPQLKLASNKLSILFSLAFFLDVGVEFTASGWLSSYAVLTDSMDKSNATICGTLFWTASTLFRFITAASSFKCSTKLNMFMRGTVICGVVFMGLNMMGAYKITAILGSIGFGISCSAVFPLLMSVPSEFKLKFRSEQLSTILFTPFLSSLFLTGITGELMNLSFDMLFYSLLINAVSLWVTWITIVKQMEGQRPEMDQQNKQMKQY